MPDTTLKYILASSLPAILARANYIGFGERKRDICRCYAVSFGLSESNGDNIFTNKVENQNFSNIIGFDQNSTFKNYEQGILDIFNSYSLTSGLDDTQKALYVSCVNSILFGYAIHSSADTFDVYKTIGFLLKNIGERIFSIQPLLVDSISEIVSHPFTPQVIIQLIETNSYLSVGMEIAGAEKDQEVDLVHYNWYDTERLFKEPDLDIMKSSENQYYYISGVLLYPNLPSSNAFCQEIKADIVTETGSFSLTYLLNEPCIDRNSYVGPVTGVKFYREFNDGPYSSGNFTEDIKQAFINFDREKLTSGEYFSNKENLYTFIANSSGGYVKLSSNILADINGQYNLDFEYKYSPMDTGCYPKYQVMRVGDERIRSQCIDYDINGVCVSCVELPTTGFKFALLELDPRIWTGEFAYTKVNPFVDEERLTKRALNFTSNPYKSTEKDGILQSFTRDSDGNENWYFGPPQITGGDVFPYLAFVEDFDSVLFNKRAKIIIRPAIGSSNGGKTTYSDRQFTISSNILATGKDNNSYNIETSYEKDVYPRAKFSETILPFNSEDDDIKLKFFGMGNALSGHPVKSISLQENAGYFYTGYEIEGLSSLENAISQYEDFKIGSSFTGIKYINGYTGDNLIESSRLYANNGSGKNIQYYYFDDRLVNGATITNLTGWSSFAPLPSGLEDNPSYSRIYETQRPENNFPRYYKGPYSKINKKFLYPNAATTSKSFDSKTNGFPEKFKYKIEVREEAVKEYFQKYTIQGGAVYDPEYIPVIRANPRGVNYDTMIDIFGCSGPDCDFNQREATGNFFYTGSITGVRENWALSKVTPFQSYDCTGYGNLNAISPVNIDLSQLPSFIDGYPMIEFEGYLLINQTNPIENGPYLTRLIINETGGVDTIFARHPSVTPDGPFFILYGNTYSGTHWFLQSKDYIVGSTPIIYNNISPCPLIENSNGYNLTLPNKYFTESLYRENANFEQGILTETTNFDFYTGNNSLLPTPNYSNRNLFHGYTGYEITGILSYTKPAFNLSKGQIDRNAANQSVALSSGGCYSYFFDSDPFDNPSLATGVANLYIKNLNGDTFYSDSGQDPIYQEYLGGRIGSGAESEGGNHSKGIIGDSWVGLNFRDFGYYCTVNGDGCSDLNRTGTWNPEAVVNSNRVPEDDDHWFMIDARDSGTKIYTRALDYNPMSFNYINNPYVLESRSPVVSLNGEESSMTFIESGEMFKLDLFSYLPTQNIEENSSFYTERSGFYIGPFDRDIEVFAIEPLSGYSRLFINNRLIFDSINGQDDAGICSTPKFVSGEITTSTFSAGGYNSTVQLQNIKNLAYVPSGEKCYIDLEIDFDVDNFNPPEGFPIGFAENSFLYIRSRKTLNDQIINGNVFGSTDFIRKFLQVSGSDFWLHNHNMTNNGMERAYEIPDGIGNLKDQTYTFVSFSRTGKMYPTPTRDFVNYIMINPDGTESLTIDGVEGYWREKSAQQSDPIYFSGWREGSRISFKFIEFEPQYGQLPYESHSIITPSGNCILSGEMGYLSQADNSIFSQGVYLKDISENDLIKEEIFGPDYVSDVLKRVPFFDYPSGTYISPIFSAPSVMKQRKNRFFIDREQSYSGLLNRYPFNYNKFLWPALSDLRTLNPEETLETIPPDDGSTYTNSTMLISASQGQKLPNGKNNPNNRKLYKVEKQYQLYDSIATDALINPDYFITSGFGFETSLKQPEEGVLAPVGTTLTEVKLGLI